MNIFSEKIAQLDKELKKTAPQPSYFEQLKQSLEEANPRTTEISGMLTAVQKELVQIVNSFAHLPLRDVDKITERYIFLLYKKDILTDMHRLANADAERLSRELVEQQGIERFKQDVANREKINRLDALRYSLDDIDIRFDKKKVKQIEDEIKQLEKELGGAAHRFVPS
jgi:predicted transcriptional regulator